MSGIGWEPQPQDDMLTGRSRAVPVGLSTMPPHPVPPAGAAGVGPSATLLVKKQLRTMALVGLIYFSVSGGPYGLEEAIGSSGAGIALIAVVVVPLIFGVPCALMAAELGSAIPVEGGYYYWVKLALGRFAGFVEAIWQWFNSFLDVALYPVVFADYLAQWVPWSARGSHVWFSMFGGALQVDTHWVTAVAFMVPLAWLNMRGSRLVGDLSVVMMAIILLPFLVMSVLGLVHMVGHGTGPDTWQLTLPHQGVWSAFGASLSVVIWNYIGWEMPSTVLSEVDRPGRTYGRALAISVPLIAISYLLPMIGALGSGLHAGHDGRWYDGDFAAAAGLLGGHWLKLAITVGAVVAQVGLFSSLLMSGVRVPRVLARDRYLPPSLARLGVYGAPSRLIVINCVIFAVFCSLDFTTLIDADILTNLAALVLEFAAFLVLRHRMPDLPRPFRVPGGWPVACLLTAGPVVLTVYMVVSTVQQEIAAFWTGVLILVLGLACYPLLTRYVKRGAPDEPLEGVADQPAG